jgi:thioredoxin 1
MREIYEDDFRSEIASGVVVVDFFASWCQPCRVLMPILEDLEKTYKGKVHFVKMQIDDESCKDLAASLGIRGVPTVILYKDGETIEKLVGLQEKDKYKESISRLI